MCFNKLNKLLKIDYELTHKLDQLRKERNDILNNLRSHKSAVNNVSNIVIVNVNSNTPVKVADRPVSNIPCIQTPKRSHTPKRVILHSPTPRKAKKCLLRINSPPSKPPSRTKKRLCDLSPGKAKVSFRGRQDEKVRTRIIKDGIWHSVVKSIVRGDKGNSISKKLYSIESLKTGLQKCVLKELENQCKTLCKVNSKSVLRNISSKNLESFSFGSLIQECQMYAPLLLETLTCVMNQPNENKVAVAAGILLRNRNIHTCLQSII
ncbi:uncharacterized protein LOC134254335 [Saccostrea cucullata]|uniref:uncharacterized protein LOC134254335 n=1 Tax=Saccostrea cuccullata TaxID=36930 RepID=UPI002ED1608D